MTTSTTFITREQLEADAVVPQCLDNQFVSERVFRYMLENRADYEDRNVHDLRELDTKTELIRSLVYSSQVILNRAYMRNNENIYKYWSRSNPRELAAAAALVKGKAVVPYLMNETSLEDGVNFDVRVPGDQAIRDLLEEVRDPIACVRLGIDDAVNSRGTRVLAQNFRGFLTRLSDYDQDQRNSLSSEIFTDRGILSEKNNWDIFNDILNDLADFSYQHNRGNILPRNELYKRYVTVPESDVSLGRFRRPDRDNPFVYEIKKLVDLIYNTTLPDLLRRYTFTPMTMPTRAALQDEASLDLDESSSNWQKLVPTDEILDYIRRHFMAQMNRAMSLPLLNHLSMADVVEIRRFDEWEAFREAQTAILRDPLGMLDVLPKYSEAFNRFQEALSLWYESKYKNAETQERYANFVTFFLKLGGRILCATVVPEGSQYLHIAADTMMDQAVDAIPKRTKGVIAKLMIGVYNTGRRQLDRERSYTIELMRSSQEVFMDEIDDLAQRLADKKKDIPMTLGHFADQGKE